MDAYIADYTAALEKEIHLARPLLKNGEVIHTIYFGGGTPTILPAQQFAHILDLIRREYPLTEDVEITTEANPLLLTVEGLRSLKKAGVERLSMGMQSGNPDELKLLGRRHTQADVEQSVDFARQAGIENINLDLIFGIPGQSLESLEESLEKALALQPQHLSLYSLTVEEATPLARMLRGGSLPEPDADVAADMYEWLMDYLPTQRFEQYEISNWARGAACRSRHNLQYWRYGPYLGFGAGAHSTKEHVRWANASAIPDYIGRVQGAQSWQVEAPPAAVDVIPLTEWDEIQESMMMGLRLTEEGVSDSVFQARFGKKLEEIYPKEIPSLVGNGLLEWAGEGGDRRLRLTCRGRMLGNQVFMQFIEG
jgi:oxygen-independent coproporphyrinogen-3 oxidase